MIVQAKLVAVSAGLQIGVVDNLTDQGGGSDNGAVFASYVLGAATTAAGFVLAVGIVIALWRACTAVDGA